MPKNGVAGTREAARGRLTGEDEVRSLDRARVLDARHRRRPLRLLWLLVGPGILVMLGENDGPSMISYATSGATYGLGFFLPFIVVTFLAAIVVQEMAMRVGAVTHRGYGELVFQRYGRFWGWLTAGDLLLTNLFTLITEFIAIRVGMAFFGIPPVLAVACGAVLVAISLSGGRYWRWERAALGLAGFNLLFVVAAFLARPAPGSVAHAFATWTPLPGGGLLPFLLLVVSDIGATVTPWMVFFQQSAVVDKGMTPRDVREGRLDIVIGGALAAAAGCGALVAASVLSGHPQELTQLQGGAGFPAALARVGGRPLATVFALGLIEAGALAALTISASTGYAIGEAISGAHSFNRRISDAPFFYVLILASALTAGLVVLIPGAPLLAIALNANLFATALLPAALVFLIMLANDRELMGSKTNGRLLNLVAIAVVAAVAVASAAYGLVAAATSIGGGGGG